MRFFKEVWGFIFEFNSIGEYLSFLLDRMESFLDMVREVGDKVLKEELPDCMVDIPNITARL